ncbi:MAG: hypothetical protein NWR47_07580 [Aestuariivirgaceae bacterium]|nr:hypothetical protein [Aestuariivirgaceae bacterium]
MRKASLFAALVIVTCVSSVQAGEPEAQACSAQLDSNAKLIFDDTLSSVVPGVDMKSVITTHTKSLVFAGKMSRSAAKPAATAAGECLKLVLN